MSDLLPSHGGLKEPIDRTVPAGEGAAFLKEATGLKKVAVSDADLSTLYRIGDGGLSPLTGPMDRADVRPRPRRGSHRSRRQELCLDHPARLSRSTRRDAGSLKTGETVALVNSKDEIVGTLQISRHLPLGQGQVHQERLRTPSAPTIPAARW